MKSFKNNRMITIGICISTIRTFDAVVQFVFKQRSIFHQVL